MSNSDILILGDSIAAGLIGGIYQQSLSWPTLLANETGRSVRNSSVGGRSAQDISPRWRFAAGFIYGGDAASLDGPEDTVILALGVNDASGFLDIAPNTAVEFGLAMGNIIGTLRRAGRSFLIVAPTWPTGLENLVPDTVSLLIEFQRFGIFLADRKTDVDSVVPALTSSHYTGLDIHPNAAGHVAIKDAVVGALP